MTEDVLHTLAVMLEWITFDARNLEVKIIYEFQASGLNPCILERHTSSYNLEGDGDDQLASISLV